MRCPTCKKEVGINLQNHIKKSHKGDGSMSEEPKEITALRQYKEENELSYDSLSKKLDVHISSVVRWLSQGVGPSPVMKRLIIAFLKKTEKGVPDEKTS